MKGEGEFVSTFWINNTSIVGGLLDAESFPRVVDDLYGFLNQW